MKLHTSLLLTLSLAALTACGGGSDDPAPAPTFAPVEVTLAHINDTHSQLDPIAATELTIDGVATQVDLGGFARVTSAFQRYANRTDVIKLHAGDAITGTLYYTLFKGQADAALMNTICFDAMVLGNHEFDDGDAGLKVFLDHLRAGTCQTPIVAANVQPKLGTPLAGLSLNEYIQPYTIKTIQGVRVAVIGLSVKGKTTNSSRPLTTTVFEDEATAAQRTINTLKAQGLRHFVVLSHLGYEADKALAAQLTDVDAIVGGDSHSLLGDFQALGLSSSGAYPTQITNKDGKPVCVAQAWEYAKAVGELNLHFNDRGEISSCSGQASLLVGSSFKRKGLDGKFVAVDDTTKTAIVQSLQSIPAVRVTELDVAASALLTTYADQVTAKKAEAIGTASEALCLVRVPGESTNRSAGVTGCEAANTLARGSDAAQIVAEAFLAGSLVADVAVQNAGGVRIPVQAGTLSMDTAFTLLPFTNVLVELKVNGQQLKDVLEDAASAHLDAAVASTGAHPYAAGLRWDLDMSQAKGSRFSNLEVRDRQTGTWSNLSLIKVYTVATNDFIASGKDGYSTFGPIYASGNYVNNYLLYTQTFVDYVQTKTALAQAISRPARSEYSHKSVITKAGAALNVN
ncbi:MAG: bifunctional metallophosphatase/5'-nucleotidase [Burkholderiales bacterium RIFCSPLOWO2_12_FULL_64_99]|nr:MAG: bifunctional metallophosphatase/5'-nucleotidase [Burkholderiales bacterium RIFCSPHIGHO2_12_FULL_63_20]OGB67269.1 MAG: bifunctional metallophosphatase/5'-nucleotidase [Burkholderiales bacterium RIFCSPLOWO2_12_FULL_64_99]